MLHIFSCAGFSRGHVRQTRKIGVGPLPGHLGRFSRSAERTTPVSKGQPMKHFLPVRLLLLAAIVFLLLPFASGADKAPSWVGRMKKVHARFTGKPGTLTLFGDSITISMAFW